MISDDQRAARGHRPGPRAIAIPLPLPWYVRLLKRRKLWMSLLALGSLASLLAVQLPA